MTMSVCLCTRVRRRVPIRPVSGFLDALTSRTSTTVSTDGKSGATLFSREENTTARAEQLTRHVNSLQHLYDIP